MKLLSKDVLKKWFVVSAFGLGTAALFSPAYSHHSFAMYDTNQEKTLTGKLVRFIPGANHAQILFALIDENGTTLVDDSGENIMWGVEMGPAARISRQGVTVRDFPVGTVVTVTLNPLRNGENFGALADAGIIKCGSELPADGCNKDTGEAFLGVQEIRAR